MNPVYLPHIKCLLRSPLCVGIVGGRPNSSLFLIGYQGDSLFYMDPHDVQPAHDPRVGGMPSYRSTTVRHMPMAQLDPSMAFGFYLAGPADVDALAELLAETEREGGGGAW